MDDQNSSRAVPLFAKMVNLADADVSEEDKLKVMMNQSTYDSINYNKKFGQVLPANYTCYRCGNTGHHIKNCPNSADKNFEAPVRIKKSTGIPRSFMVEVDGPSIKGAMLTNCGRYAIPAIDAEAYAIGKKERPPFVPQEQLSSEEEEDPTPGELLCVICHDLLSDAVVIPCCGNSYCDDCIRTTLLDSEDHICPTCSQSDVSPDTLIANRFLRQAVDNYKKERGCTKSLRKGCSATKSQNPTPTPSPVPTPPPLTLQSQPPKPHLPTHSQQDPLLYHAQAADTPPPPPSSQLSGASLTATGPASAPNTLSTSLEPVQSQLEIPDKEAEEKTLDDSAAAAAPSAPSVPVSSKDSTDAPSQLIPLVNLTPVVEQPQTVSVNLQQPSSGPTPGPSVPSTSWDSSSSSSRCPTGGWNESKTQQHLPSSSSYPATPPPPLFPSPHFHTFLTAQPPLGSYPPGYPPPTPVWALPNLQGAPIPSLCPSTSIPALMPKEWYRHQRKKKERSPHRGSAYRRSSSRSNSKTSKSKSSRSYSRSSSRSRSRSRSRSKGKSRPHSPYSHQRDLHTRSHSSHPYSYGYKRPPTPSSSSSPGAGYQSRSKSPSDHRKNSHHSRHHSKKSSWSSSRRREQSQREGGGSEGGSASSLYAQHASQSCSLELDRDRYLQWKREYKEWCDKYFSSYVGHFHQLPLPLLSLPPPPQWGYGEGSGNNSHANSDSRHQGRRRRDGRSPPSQSSSDSRSPPSQSSRDSHSTPSQSSSDSRSTPSQSTGDSRSSPSHSSNDSRSPPFQTSSDGHSTPCEDGAEPRPFQQRCTERHSRLPITRSSKEVELQGDTKNLQNLSTLKHEQKNMKKHEKGRAEESSSLDAAESTNDCRKHKSKEISPAQDGAAARDTLEPAQPLTKPDKHLDKEDERRSREQRSLEKGKRWRKDKHSESRRDAGRRHKERSNDESDRVDTHGYSYPGASRASDSRSEKNRKRKGQDIESSKCLNTEIAEEPKTHKSESPNPFERKKQKTEKKQERKTWPPTERDIWEGGIKVKPQKKISININLEGKRKEDKMEKQDLESDARKTKEEKAGNGEEEKFNKEIEAIEKMQSSGGMEGVSEEKIKPDEGETRQKWAKATFRDDKGEVFENIAGEKNDKENEEFALYQSGLRGVEEEQDGKKCDERDWMEAGKGEEVTNNEKKIERSGNEGQSLGTLVASTPKERAEEEKTYKENRGNPPGESKPKEELMDGVEWRMRREEEDTVRSKSPRSRNESHHDGPNTIVDNGSSYDDHQERKTVVSTVDEYAQDRDQEDELMLIQVPRSKWEKEESEEEEQNEGAIKVQTDALAMFLPLPSVSVTAETATNRDTETEKEKRERSVEMERDESRARERGRDKERKMTPISSTSHRSVVPSSGKDRSDSDLCSDRDGKRRMEMERQRERERHRERERSRDRQKESRRSKEGTRKEEKRRDRERERGHSSSASAQKRNSSSSSHSYSYSTSHGTERRDRQRGDRSSSCHARKSSGGRSSTVSRATELPDQNTHKSYRDTSLDLTFKDKDHHQDPSGRYRQKDRPAVTYHSPASPSHGQDKEKGLLPSGSELGRPRMSSPGQEPLSEKGKEKGEWKLRQGKGEREYQVVVVERDRGEADELDWQMKWEGGKELEDGERPSSRSNSVSSSAGQENGSDDARKEKKKKHKKPKKEKRHAAPELLEEGELKKQKQKKETSKMSRHGGEKESSGEVDAKLCSVMLS